MTFNFNIIVHKEYGVYLGAALGFGFWSKLDPVGQPAAIAFAGEHLARKVAETELKLQLKSFTILPVEIPKKEVSYASMEICVGVGVEKWEQ